MTSSQLALPAHLKSGPGLHLFKDYTSPRLYAEGDTAPDGSTLQAGQFVALAAVFDNIDSYGDRLIKGAFADTLSEWSASGDPIPVIYQHAWGDPFLHIGYVLSAQETDTGLLYKGQIDIEDNPTAAQVYRLMKGRRLKQQSFGFDVIDGMSVVEDERPVFEITKVRLYEVGPCLVGVNQATNLLDIKSGSVAPGSGATEPSGQVTPAADAPSVAPVSEPEASARKGFSPASIQLITELENMETD